MMEEIDAIIAEVLKSVSKAMKDNERKETIKKRDVVGAMAHVNKSMFRILTRTGSREVDMKECVDAIAYLVMVYAIRKNPYGEY
jgi:hypothetical protein